MLGWCRKVAGEIEYFGGNMLFGLKYFGGNIVASEK